MQECFKRKANVEVCRTSKRTRSSVRSSGFFHIPALRNIRKGEDLFMNYGDNHPIKYDQHPETLSDMEEDIDTAGASAVDEKEQSGDGEEDSGDEEEGSGDEDDESGDDEEESGDGEEGSGDEDEGSGDEKDDAGEVDDTEEEV